MRITVETPWELAQAQKKMAAKLPPGAPGSALPEKIKAIEIPKKYSDPQQSGMTFTVQEGPQVHNIELE